MFPTQTEVIRSLESDFGKRMGSFLAPNPEVLIITICDLPLTNVTEPS